MSFDQPTDSPIGRFTSFWLGLLLLGLFALVALVLTPWLKKEDDAIDEASEKRVAVQAEVAEAQKGAVEKVRESFGTVGNSLISAPQKSGKYLPGQEPVTPAAPVAPATEPAPAEEGGEGGEEESGTTEPAPTAEAEASNDE